MVLSTGSLRIRASLNSIKLGFLSYRDDTSAIFRTWNDCDHVDNRVPAQVTEVFTAITIEKDRDSKPATSSYESYDFASFW